MRRLRGADAGFLYMESEDQPTTNVYLAVLRPGTDDDGEPAPVTLEYLRAHVARRLGDIAPFRWRLQRTPFGIHHSTWVDDPDFDLDYHVRAVTLPAPGTDRELNELAARAAERTLDRRHPFWHLTIVDGFADGRQALLICFQHSLLDGAAAVHMLRTLLTDEDYEPVVAAEPWRPEPIPRPTVALAAALREHGPMIVRLPKLIRRSKRAFDEAKDFIAASPVKVPLPVIDAPSTCFNRAFGRRRIYRRTILSFDEVRRLKDLAGVSLNDVALAIVGGALREYLLARNDLPVKPLVVNIPNGVDPPGAPPRDWGNRFANVTSTLATDEPDPWERLRRIHAATKVSKQVLDIVGVDLIPLWLDYTVPLVAEPGYGLYSAYRKNRSDAVDFNVLVSNMKCSPTPQFLGRASVEELYLSGPPTDGAGLNVTLCSYNGRLMFAVLAGAEVLDGPDEIAGRLHDSLAALREAVEAHTRQTVEAG